MNGTPLESFVRAYRAESQESRLDAPAVRRRVLRTLNQRHTRKSARARWLVPIAALFLGSAALAAPALRPVVEAIVRGSDEQRHAVVVPRPKQAPARVTPHVTAAPSETADTTPSDATHTAPSKVDDTTPIIDVALLPVQQSKRPSPVAAQAEVHGSTALGAEIALYRKAHAAHFGGASPSAAIATWDEYLATYPNASFAADARYHRALCLLRLGRHDEARAALEQLARGEHGASRRTSAANLLTSLFHRESGGAPAPK